MDISRFRPLFSWPASRELPLKGLNLSSSLFTSRSPRPVRSSISSELAGSLSEETTCSRGVPQGSALGPLLFTLYIRALPEIARVPCLMFADDILLFSSSADPLTSSQELTHAVTNVYNWLDDRGLQMNVKKTQAMFVPASQVLSQEYLTLSVFCCDRQLSSVHSYKYLGVVLDSKLTWAPHMERLIRKVSSKKGVLYRSSKKLSTDAKRQYYLSVIQSDLAYGSNAFYSSLPQSAKEHLSRLSKRGVRAIFSAPPWTHTEPLLREMKLCSIDVRFKRKLLIHTYRCTHALASSLLCQQYKLRSHSNSTHSTTRSQLTLSLCIPSAARRPGTISPHSLALFFGTLFHHLLDQLLLCALSGKSCRNISESVLLGQDRPVGFPNKTTTTTTTRMATPESVPLTRKSSLPHKSRQLHPLDGNALAEEKLPLHREIDESRPAVEQSDVEEDTVCESLKSKCCLVTEAVGTCFCGFFLLIGGAMQACCLGFCGCICEIADWFDRLQAATVRGVSRVSIAVVSPHARKERPVEAAAVEHWWRFFSFFALSSFSYCRVWGGTER